MTPKANKIQNLDLLFPTFTAGSISTETSITFTGKGANCISTNGVVMTGMTSISTFIDI